MKFALVLFAVLGSSMGMMQNNMMPNQNMNWQQGMGWQQGNMGWQQQGMKPMMNNHMMKKKYMMNQMNQMYPQQQFGFNQQQAFGMNNKWPMFLFELFGLNWGYSKYQKPEGHTQVMTNMYVRKVGPMCIKENTVDMQVTVRETFRDQRLSGFPMQNASGFVTLTGKDVEWIWTPDTFFRNSKSEHILGGCQSPNIYARITPFGEITVSRRMNLKMWCPKLGENLKASGKAKCFMEMASYGYKKQDMEYVGSLTQTKLDKHAKMVMGDLDDGKKYEFDESSMNFVKEDAVTSTGKYSVLKFEFMLKAI